MGFVEGWSLVSQGQYVCVFVLSEMPAVLYFHAAYEMSILFCTIIKHKPKVMFVNSRYRNLDIQTQQTDDMH